MISDYKYQTGINNTYIITLENNPIAMEMAERCKTSCQQVGQICEFFYGVDGTGDKLIYPEHDILKLVKITNKSLTLPEIGCILSHFLLWVKCIEMDEPIVILEHDAIMIQAYSSHNFFNMIAYLGCAYQMQGSHYSLPIPPHAQLNENFRYIFKTHAYAIDPLIAAQMVAKIIKKGIYTAADVFMRINEFAIIQPGFFAYEQNGVSTIPERLNKTHEEHQKDLDDRIKFN